MFQDSLSDEVSLNISVPLETLCVLPFSCQPSAVSFNPYTFGEAVIILESGETLLWKYSRYVD